MTKTEFYAQLAEEILTEMRTNPRPGNVMAEDWSVSPGMVFRLAKKHGIHLPKRPPGLKPGMNDRRNRRIRQLKDSGLSNREIASRLGLHESTVCGVLTGYVEARNRQNRERRAQRTDA